MSSLVKQSITPFVISIMNQEHELFWLFILAIPVASIAWTVTHEEVFREPREYCVRQSKEAPRLLKRKFFYLFTCEFCFSHYVTVFILFLTNYTLYHDDWRGYILSGFSLVWIANFYMSIYNKIRIDLKTGKLISKKQEHILNEQKKED
jgi:hypothetical protein